MEKTRILQVRDIVATEWERRQAIERFIEDAVNENGGEIRIQDTIVHSIGGVIDCQSYATRIFSEEYRPGLFVYNVDGYIGHHYGDDQEPMEDMSFDEIRMPELCDLAMSVIEALGETT